jgi:diguanylate cyclase (GGDEF)-like protein/PAS domain S-box-containing protein
LTFPIDEEFYRRQYYKLLEFLPIPIAVSELVGKKQNFLLFKTHYVNKKYTEVTGWTIEEVPNNIIGHELAYPEPNYRQEIEQLIYQRINSLSSRETSIRFISKVRCKNGEERYFETFIEIADSLRPNFYTTAYIDIMPLKSKLEKLEELSQKDPLTGLLNRRAMLEILERENARFQRTNQSYVIVFADLDKFKQINDSFGHACGDYVIVKTSQILKENLRNCDYVARWGGEEFLILLIETTLNGSLNYLERLREKLSKEKFIWQENHLTVTLTFGIAVHYHNQTIQKTIEQADSALYQGKSEGRNCIIVYEN